jgi:hypothetical protein
MTAVMASAGHQPMKSLHFDTQVPRLRSLGLFVFNLTVAVGAGLFYPTQGRVSLMKNRPYQSNRPIEVLRRASCLAAHLAHHARVLETTRARRRSGNVPERRRTIRQRHRPRSVEDQLRSLQSCVTDRLRKL